MGLCKETFHPGTWRVGHDRRDLGGENTLTMMVQLSRDLAVRDEISKQERSAMEAKAVCEILKHQPTPRALLSLINYLLLGSQRWKQFPVRQGCKLSKNL